MAKRYHWDFYGPHAKGKAAHFIKHLTEFLATLELEGCQHGVEHGERGASAWCIAVPGAEAAIETRLRPHRQDEADLESS